MAGVNQAGKFWKTIKAVSVPEIARESKKPVSMTVIGEPQKRETVLKALFAKPAETDVVPDRSLVQVFNSTDPETGFTTDAGPLNIVIDAGGGRTEAPMTVPIYSIEELGGWDRVLERIIEQRPDLSLSLARQYPVFRRAVSERIIKDISLANAEFAMLNALPGIVPIIAPLLPAAAIGDIFMLTKNQAMMLFRLAAAHDLPLDLRARSKDLGPLLGNAFGWRALAREVVGMVPGGVGLVARGAIAYAGTAALGMALLRYYETGQLPNRAQINRFYKEAYAGAKKIAEERLRALRGKPAAETPQLSAPATEEEPKALSPAEPATKD
jgi:uncharacterized protein (DUF697 family)